MAKTATRNKTIRVSVNDDVQRALTAMKNEYPALDEAEILKLGLSTIYREWEIKTRQAWIDSLPERELTDKEQAELTIALRSAEEAPGVIMTPDEIVAEALGD